MESSLFSQSAQLSFWDGKNLKRICSDQLQEQCLQLGQTIVRTLPQQNTLALKIKSPELFIKAFIAGLSAGKLVALLDPYGPTAYDELCLGQLPSAHLLTDDHITRLLIDGKRETDRSPALGKFIIFSSGSSDRPKAYVHSAQSLYLQAQAFEEFFCLKKNPIFYNCLPLHRVGGLMGVFRALFLGGQLIQLTTSLKVTANLFPKQIDYISLVPTQLDFLTNEADEGALQILKNSRAILVGGQRIEKGLKERAHHLKLPLSPTYGLTEACSSVAGIRPEDFLQGNFTFASIYPDCHIELGASQTAIIKTNRAFLGKYHEKIFYDNPEPQMIHTQDQIEIINKKVKIIGRADRTIISGGINIDLNLVESLFLKLTNNPIQAFGLAHKKWGEALVVILNQNENPQNLKSSFKKIAPSYLVPKFIFTCPDHLQDLFQNKDHLFKIKFWAQEKMNEQINKENSVGTP